MKSLGHAMRLLPFAALLGAMALLVMLFVWPGDAPAAGTFSVTVEGPEGVLWSGNATAEAATAKSLLLAAAEQGGFEVEATGRGDGWFVVAIDGVRNEGAGGWCFAFGQPGEWRYPASGAARAAPEPGESVWWVYRPDGCPGLA